MRRIILKTLSFMELKRNFDFLNLFLLRQLTFSSRSVKSFNRFLKNHSLFSSSFIFMAKPIIIHNFLHHSNTAGEEDVFTWLELFFNRRRDHLPNFSLKNQTIIKKYFYFFYPYHRMNPVSDIIPKPYQCEAELLWECYLNRNLPFLLAFPLRRNVVYAFFVWKDIKEERPLVSTWLSDFNWVDFLSLLSEKLNFVQP